MQTYKILQLDLLTFPKVKAFLSPYIFFEGHRCSHQSLCSHKTGRTRTNSIKFSSEIELNALTLSLQSYAWLATARWRQTHHVPQSHEEQGSKGARRQGRIFIGKRSFSDA